MSSLLLIAHANERVSVFRSQRSAWSSSSETSTMTTDWTRGTSRANHEGAESNG
jgi:hypothetical protein